MKHFATVFSLLLCAHGSVFDVIGCSSPADDLPDSPLTSPGESGDHRNLREDGATQGQDGAKPDSGSSNDEDASLVPGDPPVVDANIVTCRNGTRDIDEVCDSDEKNCALIDSNAFLSGSAPCNNTCTGYDTTGCTRKPNESSPVEIGAEPSKYLAINELYKTLKQWAQNADKFSEYVVFGKSGSYDNVAIRLSSAVSNPASTLPKVLINSGIHGDEQIGTASVLGVVHRFISKYGRDQKVTDIINTRDIYFVPINNPPGYAANDRDESGQDPNRSFPWPGGENQKGTPSVQNLQAFFIDKKFNAVFDIHASGRMILLPWAYTASKFEDGTAGERHRKLGKELADLSGYRWGTVRNMVGYIAPGSSIDWWYLEGKKRGFHTCVMGAEIGTSKKPPASSIPNEVNRQYAIVMDFVEKGPIALTSYAGYASYDVEEPYYATPDPYFVPGLE